MRNIFTSIPFIVLFATLVGCTGKEPALPYSSLVSEIKAGNVKHVEIESGSVVTDFKGPIANDGTESFTYRTTLPHGEEIESEFTELLEEANVPFSFADR